MTTNASPPTVHELATTPLKGTRLHHPTSIQLESYGAAGDRRFFLVDHDGRRVEASNAPLTLVDANWDPTDDTLTITLPDGTNIAGRVELGEPVDAIVPDTGQVATGRVVLGPWADALSDYLNQRVQLAATPTPAPALDVAPVTVISIASITALEAHMSVADLGHRRFRMTLTLSDTDAFEEDTWYGRDAAVGSALLRFGGAVPRCVVTARDTRTGTRDHPVLSALRTLRSPIIDPVHGEVPLPLGIYATVIRPGTISVGDPIELLPPGAIETT